MSASDNSTTTAVYAALGFGGGLLVSFCQIPQIVRVHKRKTTLDISYGYQVSTYPTSLRKQGQLKGSL